MGKRQQQMYIAMPVITTYFTFTLILKSFTNRLIQSLASRKYLAIQLNRRQTNGGTQTVELYVCREAFIRLQTPSISAGP